jgi:hypothetical protein
LFEAETSQELADCEAELPQAFKYGCDQEAGHECSASLQLGQSLESATDALSLASACNDPLPDITTFLVKPEDIVRRSSVRRANIRKLHVMGQEIKSKKYEDSGCEDCKGTDLPPTPPSSPAAQHHQRERHFLCRQLLQDRKQLSSVGKPISKAGVKNALPADSLASLSHLDEMCGFTVGESVTTSSGPDDSGPWQRMGNGKVVGPGLRKGYLNVVFKPADGHSEPFEVKAKNLVRVSENFSRFHQESKMKDYGIRLGEPVILNSRTRGVVVEAGPASENVMVKFRGIGTKEVRLAHLNKVTLDLEKYGMRCDLKHASRAERQRIRCLAAAEWADVEMTEQEVWTASEEVAEKGLCNIQVGAYVLARYEPWSQLGIGIVKHVGSRPGSVRVRFNVQQESWSFDCKDLKEVSRPPGLCKFAVHKRLFDFERGLDAKCRL